MKYCDGQTADAGRKLDEYSSTEHGQQGRLLTGGKTFLMQDGQFPVEYGAEMIAKTLAGFLYGRAFVSQQKFQRSDFFAGQAAGDNGRKTG